MSVKTSHGHKHRRRGKLAGEPQKPKLWNKILEHRLVKKADTDQYREKVRDVYDGPQGAMLATCSLLSLHTTFGERLFSKQKFSLAGARRILDVGSGAGQIAKHLIKYSDPWAEIVCSDLSPEMLRRAKQRFRSDRPQFVAADITRLPFGDGEFDCVTCGYVLEHLLDPRPGLRELSRVMEPGARMLLLTTEDNFSGACTSLMWCCRTYNRRELRAICHEVGLAWGEELWFTRIHKALRAGGICVELTKR